MRTNIFDRLSFISLSLVVTLLPVFFLPFSNVSIETSKGLILVIGLALSVIFWSLARFFDGKIVLARSPVLLASLIVVFVTFLSAVFSKAVEASLFGTMFDVGSFWFILSGFVLMFMSSIIFRSEKNAKILLFGAILSSVVVLIFQALHLFFPQALSLGVMTSKTSNLVGSWKTLGIFAGFSTLMSLLIVEFFSTTKRERVILQVLTVLSILMVAAVNFQFVWKTIGIFSLIIFLYKLSTTYTPKEEGEGREKFHFPIFSFTVMMLSLLVFISGQFVAGVIPNALNLQNENAEIGLTFRETFLTTKSVIKENPILGVGPNRFMDAWSMYKSNINATGFWNVSFSSGAGLIPTILATIGSLGILAWLLFFGLYINYGARSIYRGMKHGINWETMAFFVLSFYLFISSFFYPTGPVIFLLALAFAGVFIGLSSANHPKGELHIAFLDKENKNFFPMLLVIVLIILSTSFSFKYIERFASVPYFGKALVTDVTNLPVAQTSIGKAISLYPNDLYLRTYSEIYAVKFNSLATKEEPLTEEEKAELQVSLNAAVAGAEAAIRYNPNNYYNHQALGFVYQNAGALGVKDVYDKAIKAYEQAALLNPKNPGIQISIANVYLAQRKFEEARKYASAALTLKPNYIDGLVISAQIERLSGNNTAALTFAKQALALAPENKDLKNYVNSLENSSSVSNITPPTIEDDSVQN